VEHFVLPYGPAVFMRVLLSWFNKIRQITCVYDLVLHCGLGGMFYLMMILVMGKERLRTIIQ